MYLETLPACLESSAESCSKVCFVSMKSRIRLLNLDLERAPEEEVRVGADQVAERDDLAHADAPGVVADVVEAQAPRPRLQERPARMTDPELSHAIDPLGVAAQERHVLVEVARLVAEGDVSRLDRGEPRPEQDDLVMAGREGLEVRGLHAPRG